MAKYSNELVEKIVDLLKEDTYSIDALAHCDEKLQALARRSLKLKLEGYVVTEVRTVYTPDENDPSDWKVKARIVREKEYAPDDKAIRFVLRDKSSKKDELEENQAVLNITVMNKDASEMLVNLGKSLQGTSSLSHQRSSSLPTSCGRKGDCEADKFEEQNELTTRKDPRGSPETIQNEEVKITKSEELEKDDKDTPILEEGKVKGKKKILVRDYCLPPGYLYRVEEVDEEE
ncbi:MAG: hypothetical protein E6767_05290 [Dysgonomonas sp.]|nr:hypothetical protein [Dysgonomonas sp.]